MPTGTRKRRMPSSAWMPSSRLLFVVHIQQEDDRIRLISARKATREERDLYENC